MENEITATNLESVGKRKISSPRLSSKLLSKRPKKIFKKRTVTKR